MSTRKELESFGYRFLGPVIAAFYDSVFDEVANSDCNKVYFLAREGYFLKELFSHYKKLIKSPYEIDVEYLLCSRAFLFKLCLVDECGIKGSLIHPYQGSMKDLLIRRYGFNGADLDKILSAIPGAERILKMELKLPSCANSVHTFLVSVGRVLHDELMSKRNLYVNYLKVLDFTKGDEPKHVVDIGFSGTIQKYLAVISEQNIEGHYMATTRKAINTNQCRYHGHLGRNMNFSEGFSLIDQSLFLEAVLTAPHGQLVDIFSVNGEVRFGFASKTLAQHNFGILESVVEGAKEYMTDTLVDRLQLEVCDIPDYYSSLVSNMSGLPFELKRVFEVDDHISGFGIINPAQLFG